MNSNANDVGNALKTILERLSKFNESNEIPHRCTTCKYRMTETYVDDQWGFEQVWHNWCKLDKRNMELKFGKGNDKYFHKEDCQYWESNKN